MSLTSVYKLFAENLESKSPKENSIGDFIFLKFILFKI